MDITIATIVGDALNSGQSLKKIKEKLNAAVYKATQPTPEELCNILGSKWAICRTSANNRAKYGRCISYHRFVTAEQEAIKNRYA